MRPIALASRTAPNPSRVLLLGTVATESVEHKSALLKLGVPAWWALIHSQFAEPAATPAVAAPVLVGSGGGKCARSRHRSACSMLQLQETGLPSAKPNLAVKRTPNGRPRSGIMFILASARPAVWCRLPLR
jgi:hypothetical protein